MWCENRGVLVLFVVLLFYLGSDCCDSDSSSTYFSF